MNTNTNTPAKPDPSLASVEAMIVELTAMRDTGRSRDIKSAYQAAIDRLVGLAYRLRQPRPVTIGRPPRHSILVGPDPEPAAHPCSAAARVAARAGCCDQAAKSGGD